MALIAAPSPRRPLKRRFLEEFDDQQETQERYTKRFAYQSLWDAPTYVLQRSQSVDSFFRMSSRPQRESQLPKRYRTSTDLSSRCLTPLSTKSHSITADSTTATPFSSASESKPKNRAYTGSYRKDLARNEIYIQPSRLAPPEVIEYAQEIYRQTRTSPGMQPHEARHVMDVMDNLQFNGVDEGVLRNALYSTQLLPGPPLVSDMSMGASLPFSLDSIPQAPMAPSLSQPKPDLVYCLDERVFTAEDENIMRSCGLKPHKKALTAGVYPYFMVELKSPAKGGTWWAADNQNAGSGASCVYMMENLLERLGDLDSTIDTIAFSCHLDTRGAEIWTHWCKKEEKKQYMSAEVEYVRWNKEDEVIMFRNAFRNLAEFGVKVRLPRIRDALRKAGMNDDVGYTETSGAKRVAKSNLESKRQRHGS